MNDRFGELVEADLTHVNWTMKNTLEHPDDDKKRI
jgi:hypothetical protein